MILFKYSNSGKAYILKSTMDEFADIPVKQILDIADADARYDTAARKLVAQKSILAYILKSTMDEFADIPVKQIAEELIEGSPLVSETYFRIHQIKMEK